MKIMANFLRHPIIVSAMGILLTTIYVFAQARGEILPAHLNSVCVDIKTVVGTLTIVLVIMCVILYAISHFVSDKGNKKKNLRKWSRNMLIVAVIALIVYMLAPYIASVIISMGGNSIVVC